MGHLQELSQRQQRGFGSRALQPPEGDAGAFGYRRQRRLGSRVRTKCWALLSRGSSSTYAVAVELSPTGVLLHFVGRRAHLLFRPEQHFRLDLFVPGSPRPVQTVVRPVRRVGELQAFELVESSDAERLTLAEYLDRLMTDDDLRTAVRFRRRAS